MIVCSQAWTEPTRLLNSSRDHAACHLAAAMLLRRKGLTFCDARPRNKDTGAQEAPFSEHLQIPANVRKARLASPAQHVISLPLNGWTSSLRPTVHVVDLSPQAACKNSLPKSCPLTTVLPHHCYPLQLSCAPRRELIGGVLPRKKLDTQLLAGIVS